jgi:septal ring factor EnvC (AmiA/AmiB activator)
MGMNKDFLDYFGKNFAGVEFTIDDLRNDGYIMSLLEQEELEQSMEENAFYLRQMNVKEKEEEIDDEFKEKKEGLEKELEEQKETFKELNDKEWESTTYTKKNPLPIDYSEMDQKELYYQQRFEQRLSIMLSMIGMGGKDNSLSEKNMNKSMADFMEFKSKIGNLQFN